MLLWCGRHPREENQQSSGWEAPKKRRQVPKNESASCGCVFVTDTSESPINEEAAVTLRRKRPNHPRGPWPPPLLGRGAAGGGGSGVGAHLGTVGLTVHGLDGSREVPAAVPMLVRRV